MQSNCLIDKNHLYHWNRHFDSSNPIHRHIKSEDTKLLELVVLLIEDFGPTEDRLAMPISAVSNLYSIEDIRMCAYHRL